MMIRAMHKMQFVRCTSNYLMGIKLLLKLLRGNARQRTVVQVNIVSLLMVWRIVPVGRISKTSPVHAATYYIVKYIWKVAKSGVSLNLVVHVK